MSDKIMVDDEVDALSQGQLLVITARAARKLGFEADFTPEGKLKIDEGINIHSDEFLIAWEHEATLMVATHMTARMVDEGLLYVDGIDVDGNFIYKPVPGVQKAYDGQD